MDSSNADDDWRCRAVKGELLERLVDWIVDKLSDDDWSMSQIKAVLAQA